MNDLPSVLNNVRDRISRYRGQAIGEENTKSALIDPVLRALGWDLEDLDEVRHEYRRKPGDNPVDYALFLLRAPRLFVEAKALGENLADHRWASQFIGYAGPSPDVPGNGGQSSESGPARKMGVERPTSPRAAVPGGIGHDPLIVRRATAEPTTELRRT